MFNTEWMAQESMNLEAMATLVSMVTGLDFDTAKLKEVTDRCWQIERAFSVREGISAADDIPSPRYFEPMPSGPQKGKKLEHKPFEELLRVYYQKRGWDRNGIPTREKLESLGIKSVADSLGVK